MTGLHRTATLDTDNATGDAFGRLRVSEPAHAACIASPLPTEDAVAKFAEAGLDVVLPE